VKGKKRNKNGTFRNNNKAAQVGASMIRAAWVEAETLRCKSRMGFTFESIAEHIRRVAAGKEKPMVDLRDGIDFPPDYSITGQACGHALSRALARVPNIEAAEMRQIDGERYEYLYGAAQPGVSKSSAQHILAAASVLEKKAKLGGYAAPEKVELTGKDGEALIPIGALRQLEDEKDD
jgi:hypothetical protein